MRHIESTLMKMSQYLGENIATEMVDHWFSFAKKDDEFLIINYGGNNAKNFQYFFERYTTKVQQMMAMAWAGEPYIGICNSDPAFFLVYKLCRNQNGEVDEGRCYVIDITKWNQNGVMVTVTDIYGRYKFATPCFLDVLGYDIESLTKKNFYSMVDYDFLEEFIIARDYLMLTKKPRYTHFKIRKSNGERVSFFGISIPVISPINKNVLCFLTISITSSH